MTLIQASKIYCRAAVVVLPIWILGLYVIEVVLEKAVGFPDNARGWGYRTAYHYDPLALETISLMVVAMLLLLRRASSKNQDRACFMEIPLVVFAYLYLANSNGVAHLFQNINPPVLHYGVLLLFIPILFLIGIMVALFSYWRHKFHERSVSVKSRKWTVVLLYLCAVAMLSILYYSAQKIIVMLAAASPFWGHFLIGGSSSSFFLSGLVAPILRWMHLDNFTASYVVMSSGPLIVILIITFFLFCRIFGAEPNRVYKVEIPIITLVCWLYGAANFVLLYSTTVIPSFDANIIELLPPLVAWLWMTITAYVLIRVKNRLKL